MNTASITEWLNLSTVWDSLYCYCDTK